MRIHVSFIDRVGITQDVLALLVGRNLNLDAVEMVPPNVYIDAPALSATVLDDLREALLRVRGVQAVSVVEMLPGQHRSEQLEALLSSMRAPVITAEPVDGFDTLIGDSQPLRALKARAQRIAALDAPLLIHGETGTGKELVARACHAASARSEQPFLALNCAALPENLAESELFGYAPGAFTGAQRGGKPGLLELAHRGTLFLDEIGEMSAYLQAKLLRFLNDGSFRRVGGDREVKVDVRILSATHRDLKKMVGDGTFREDLFYRLNVLDLDVPPLRERGQDILQLARHFLHQACGKIQRPPCRLAPDVFPALLGHGWPGNVRQLQNVIFRAAAVCEGTLVEIGHLDISAARQAAVGEVGTLEAAVEGFEKDLLMRLYDQHPSSRQLAARLGTSHSAIATRLRKYGIPGKA